MSRKRSLRLAVASTAAALTLGLTAVGIATAATPPAPATHSSSAAPTTSSTTSTTTPGDTDQMKQQMTKMLRTLPSQQRAAIQKMHDQMPVAMKRMTAGNKMMPQNKSDAGHTGQTPAAMSSTDPMMGG